MAAGFGVENWCVQRGMTKIYRKKNAWGPCLFRQDERMRYTFTKVVPWTWTRVSNLGTLEREKNVGKRNETTGFGTSSTQRFSTPFDATYEMTFGYTFTYILVRGAEGSLTFRALALGPIPHLARLINWLLKNRCFPVVQTRCWIVQQDMQLHTHSVIKSSSFRLDSNWVFGLVVYTLGHFDPDFNFRAYYPCFRNIFRSSL